MSQQDLSTGPVGRRLAGLAWPMTLGLLAAMSVSLADAFFLGRLGTGELAAISFAFPVVFTFTSVSIGLGAGAASVVSRAIGRGDRAEARRLATDSLGLAVALMMALSALGWLAARPLFAALGAQGAVLDDAVAYMRVWYPSMPFLVVVMVANNILRAGGDARAPSAILVAMAAVNLALAPLLIFGLGGLPRLEVEGAAWASLVARAAVAGASLAVLAIRDRLIEGARPPLRALWASWRRVLAIALPAALGNAVAPLGVAAVTAALAGFGTASVAAFGVATRVEAFATLPMLALSAAIGPVAGQSWGAGRAERVEEALRGAFLFCLLWSGLLAAAFWAVGEEVAAAFTDDPTVAAQAASYLRVVSLSLVGYGVAVVAAGAFNALGRPLTALGYHLLRTVGLLVPLAWAAAALAGPRAVFVAIALANAVAGGLIARHALRRLAPFADRAGAEGSAPARRARGVKEFAGPEGALPKD